MLREGWDNHDVLRELDIKGPSAVEGRAGVSILDVDKYMSKMEGLVLRERKCICGPNAGRTLRVWALAAPTHAEDDYTPGEPLRAALEEAGVRERMLQDGWSTQDVIRELGAAEMRAADVDLYLAREEGLRCMKRPCEGGPNKGTTAWVWCRR